MPRATERLSRSSSQEQIDTAIDSTIRELRQVGRDNDEATAIAFEEARRKTGRRLRRPRRGRKRPPSNLIDRERAGNAVRETLG